MKIKIFYYLAIFLIYCFSFSQNETYISGSLESNSQLLQDDNGLNFFSPQDNFRSNNYFQVDFQNGNFSAGVQYESYLPSALLGYSEIYNNESGIAQYYFKYEDQKNEIKVGSIYEQFGNGLIFRAWEDRQLGINNSIKGINYKFFPTSNLEISAIHGKQRNGFEYSNSTITGLNSDFDISSILESEKIGLSFGVSYINRFQENNEVINAPENVNLIGARLNLFLDKIYINLEIAKKGKDVLVNEEQIISAKEYDGTAMQIDFGYSRKGLGINSSFRRLENFNFYSDRLSEGNIYNQQTISFTPALTKQQDYMLTNIYVYNSQPRLVINDIEKRVGEVGIQNDIFYTFNKESFLGKYKTKLAVNFSYWSSIEANFNSDESYDVEFIGNGKRLYKDLNFEIKNRWNKKVSSTLTFVDLSIDKGVTLGGPLGVQGNIDARIGVFELNFLDKNNRNNRIVAQQLWTNDDKKEWAGLVYEYAVSNKLNVFVSDIWNYGNENDLHYYNIGGSYSNGPSRISLNYGRQRGGLICVGGVCRFVPESNGFNLNLSYSF